MSSVFRPRAFYRANNRQEVINIQKEFGERARIVGGNTFLNELAKRGLLGSVEALIDIGQLNLRYLRVGKEVEIGASASIQDIAESKTLASEPSLRALSQAANSVHPPQVRHTATAAGCVSTGLSFLDMPIALLALEARVKLFGEAGESELPLEEYVTDPFGLTRVGFVTGLSIYRNVKSRSSFRRFAVTGSDYAAVNAAVSLAKDGAGKCTEISLFVGGSGLDLQRAVAGESKLKGRQVNRDLLEAAAEATAAGASVKDDIPLRGSAEYKRKVAMVTVLKALEDAAGGAPGGDRA